MGTEQQNIEQPAGDQGEQQELSLREELEASFEAAEEPDAAAGTAGQRERDELGRFTAKQQAEADAAAAAAGKAPEQALPTIPAAPAAQRQPQPGVGAPVAPELKAPGSWRPEVREKWARVDPEVRNEVVRREREFQQVLMQGAQQRQFVDAFEKVVSPYQLFIRAENSTPLQAVDNLMATAAMLRTGNQQQRVQVVGSIIKQWLGSQQDLEALDQFLAGAAGQQQAQQMQPQQEFRDPRLDMILAQQAQARQMEEQQQSQQLDQGIQAFASDPKHEFFEDVRMLMGDIIEMAGRRGEVVTMEAAYQRACQLTPEVSTILSQRASAAKAGQLSQAALRAKRAARSITGDSTPEGGTVPRGDDVRSALEAAFEAHEGR